MISEEEDTVAGPSKGAGNSIVQQFSIEGLYGYRDISLASPYAATILIAKNGTGKTTLLGALDAFLRMQLGRLRGLDFKKIRCKLLDVEEELTLSHDDVISFLQVPEDPDFKRTAARASIEPKALFNFLVDEYISGNRLDFSNSDKRTYNALISSFSYSYKEFEASLERLTDNIFSRNDNIAQIRRVLKSRLSDIQIVYLPTYRRVELALTDENETPGARRRRNPKFSVAAGSLFTGDIQFGLGDISERLSEINNEIVYSSNNGYGEISAKIINDLIDGKIDAESVNEEILPSKDDLKLFFSRLKHGRRVMPFAPVEEPNLEKIFDREELSPLSRVFLPYFLNQLGKVVKTAQSLEEPVSLFVNSCNKYLLSSEPSTEKKGATGAHDQKKMIVSRKNFRVHVKSVPGGRRISLNALSSGEKQMISLFAKLFLYPKEKIVLIDEPELSLSIDWQSTILVDVLNAPLCRQVVAITHSPFVFDNELDPFARPLSVRTLPIPDEDHDPDADFGEDDDD